MNRVRCRACQGTYTTMLPDGSTYYHVCPPLSHAEVAAAVAAGTITLPKGESLDDALDRREYPRPDARNENLTTTSAAAAARALVAAAVLDRAGAAQVERHPVEMIAAGAGVDELPDDPAKGVL